MPRGRYGQFNQAGDLAPKTGEQSRAFLRNRGALLVESEPLVAVHGFDDFTAAGAVISGVKDAAVVPVRGYHGDLPASLLPIVQRTMPWEDIDNE